MSGLDSLLIQTVANTTVSPYETVTLPLACLAQSPVEKKNVLFPKLGMDNEADILFEIELLCNLSVVLGVFVLKIRKKPTPPAN